MEASYLADDCAQVAFGLFDPSHASELMEKEAGTLASMTVTDAVVGLGLLGGETPGRRLKGLADLS